MRNVTDGETASDMRDVSAPPRSLRILHVIPYFHKSYGGEVNACLSIVKELARRGHAVTVLTSDCRFNEDEMRVEGVEIIALHTVTELGLIKYTPDIKRWMREHAGCFDVCHIHSFRNYQNMGLIDLLERYRLPFVVEVHGSLPLIGHRISKKLFDIFWGRRILKGAYRVLALNEREMDQCRKFGVPDEKISIIPNGIDLKSWDRYMKGVDPSLPLNIPDDHVLLLFLGRLNSIKGLTMLIDSFSMVVEAYPSAILLIVGPDDGAEQETRMAIKDHGLSDKVRMLHPIFDDRQKVRIYQNCDLFLIPSIYDLFPITLLEAWASRLPVIATKGCGMYKEIEEGGLVAEYDAYDYSKAVIELVNNRTLAKELGERGRAVVESRYDWSVIIDKLVDIYWRAVQRDSAAE